MKKDLLKNNPAVGISWEEARKELFTPEEIAASDLRVAIIGELIKARREKGLTQKELENITGIKQHSFEYCCVFTIGAEDRT